MMFCQGITYRSGIALKHLEHSHFLISEAFDNLKHLKPLNHLKRLKIQAIQWFMGCRLFK